MTTPREVSADHASHLSDVPTYNEEPPRLSVCINEVALMPDRLAEGADPAATLPTEDDPATPAGAKWVEAKAAWIVEMLQKVPIDLAWFAPAGRLDLQYDDLLGEAWARKVEELLLGAAYGGPEITANLPKKSPFAKKAGLYIYQRFQPRFVSWEQVSNDKLWWKGVPADAVWETNDDPAYSLWMACQHLATFINLARGVTVEEDLNRAGFGAGQCGHITVFNDGGGTWYGTGKVPEGRSWKQVGTDVLEVPKAFETAPDLGAGTIFTFNPYGDAKYKVIKVPPSVLLQEDGEVVMGDDGFPALDPTKKKEVLDLELKSAQAVQEHNKDLKKGEARQDVAVDGSPDEGVNARIPLRAQVSGSHIFAVLRRWKLADGTQGFQVLDTHAPTDKAQKPGQKPGEAKLREYGMWDRTSYNGIFCGEAKRRVGAGAGTKFVGFGVVSKQADAQEMLAHLRKLRPVGVARLVISKREHEDPKRKWLGKLLTENDLLYVSRGVAMWGAGPEDNYPISKYLWSLRNTPYYMNLQAFWLIYAPRQELAEVMFAAGARGQSLDELVRAAEEKREENNARVMNPKDRKPLRCIEGAAIRITTLLSHDAMGKAKVLWRGKDGSASGDGSPPKLIKNLFMDGSILYRFQPKEPTALEAAQRSLLAEYVHPGMGTLGLELPAYLAGAPAAGTNGASGSSGLVS
jgi:hypothetical protein